VQNREDFVTGGKTQRALREWRSDLRSPVTAAALVAVAAVLTLAGPFETNEVLRFGPRAAYWLAMVGLTYGAGTLINALLRSWLAGRKQPLIMVASGAATGFAICGIVLTMNALALDYVPRGPDLVPFVATVFAISMIISLSLSYAYLQTAPPAKVPTQVPLMERLPLEKRGALVALSVGDHYVRVQTRKGEEMLLMRLSDAIRETGTLEGAQVHRSHWVAFGQVTAARRQGDRAILTLSTGAELPVSRANLPKIKEAGLLPR